MKSNKFTQQEIEETFNSIDGISRADAPPFFFTRLQAKLDNRSHSPQAFWLIVTKPVVSLVTLSLLVILNIVAISYFIKSSKQPVSMESSGIQNFAQEYNLTAATSIYNDKTTR